MFSHEIRQQLFSHSTKQFDYFQFREHKYWLSFYHSLKSLIYPSYKGDIVKKGRKSSLVNK